MAKSRANHELAVTIGTRIRHPVAGDMGECSLRRRTNDTWWTPKFLRCIVNYFSHNEKALRDVAFNKANEQPKGLHD